MKHLFTGTWIFVIVSGFLYLMFKYVAYPFTVMALEANNEPVIEGEAIVMAFFFTFLLTMLSVLLVWGLYKLGEAVNNR